MSSHVTLVLEKDKPTLEWITQGLDYGKGKITKGWVGTLVKRLLAILKEDKRGLKKVGIEKILEDHNKEIAKQRIEALKEHFLTMSSHKTHAHVLKEDKERLEEIIQVHD